MILKESAGENNIHRIQLHKSYQVSLPFHTPQEEDVYMFRHFSSFLDISFLFSRSIL